MARGYVDGGQELLALSVQLGEADKKLLRSMRKRIRAATATAAEAVVAEELAVLPKRGGLNEWIAAAPVKVSILSSPKTAGVRLRQGRNKTAPTVKGLSRSNLRLANQTGKVRHPNRAGHGFSIDRRDESGGWSNTTVPAEWWEAALAPTKIAVAVEMRAVMDDVARAAGFR